MERAPASKLVLVHSSWTTAAVCVGACVSTPVVLSPIREPILVLVWDGRLIAVEEEWEGEEVVLWWFEFASWGVGRASANNQLCARLGLRRSKLATRYRRISL